METAEKELTLEEAFLRLEEVTRALEDENISLEESFTVYQKGMELLKYCNESIDSDGRELPAVWRELCNCGAFYGGVGNDSQLFPGTRRPACDG